MMKMKEMIKEMMKEMIKMKKEMINIAYQKNMRSSMKWMKMMKRKFFRRRSFPT